MKYTIPWVVNSRPHLRRALLCSLPPVFSSVAPPWFTPLSLPLFSWTYELPNLQALCFQILTTVGGQGSLPLTCVPLCKFAPLFSIASRMPLPQPFSFHAFALLPGVGIPLQQKHTNYARAQAGGTPNQRKVEVYKEDLSLCFLTSLRPYFGFRLGGIPSEGGAKAAGCCGAKQYAPQPGRQG